MNSTPTSLQRDMFATAPAGFTPLVLEIKGIAVPPNKSRKDQARKTSRPLPPNCHIPSFKNSKQIVMMGKKPFLITKKEFKEWMEKVVQHLESTLLSVCQTGFDATPLVRLRLSAILSRLPADDSVNDLTAGSWKVETVSPGEEGALITITRLT